MKIKEEESENWERKMGKDRRKDLGVESVDGDAGEDWVMSAMEGWQEKCVKHLGELITGRTPSTKRKDFYDGDYNLISRQPILTMESMSKPLTRGLRYLGSSNAALFLRILCLLDV